MIQEWIPSITTTSLFSVVIFLSRNLIITRLKNAVKHDYDKKIEAVKSTLKQSEEKFRADLRRKELEITALRESALSGVVNKQEELYKKQVTSVEQIWDGVISLDKAKTISAMMATMKYEVILKESTIDPRIQEFAEMIGGDFRIQDINIKGALLARPFITPLAWAYFSAYKSIITQAAMRWHILKTGIGKDFSDTKHMTNLVKAVLPHQTDYIDKHGPESFHFLLDEIEQMLLTELKNILKGLESDKESIERAAQILEESEKVMKETNTMPTGA